MDVVEEDKEEEGKRGGGGEGGRGSVRGGRGEEEKRTRIDGTYGGWRSVLVGG